MATFSVTTTATQDRAVQYLTQRQNAQNPTDPPVSALEFARTRIDHLFDGLVEQVRGEIRINKGDLYNRASDADQATIDAILAKYQ